MTIKEEHNIAFQEEVLENKMFDEYDKNIIMAHLSNFYCVFQLGWDRAKKEGQAQNVNCIFWQNCHCNSIEKQRKQVEELKKEITARMVLLDRTSLRGPKIYEIIDKIFKEKK